MNVQRKLGLALIITGLVACQKEAPLSPSASNDTAEATLKYSGGPQMKYKLERNHEGDDKCPNSGSNCSKIELLKAQDTGGMQRVLDAVRTGDNTTIRNIFAAEKPTLGLYMADQDINAVIGGALQPTTSFNALENAHFIIVGASNDVRAYRVQFP